MRHTYYERGLHVACDQCSAALPNRPRRLSLLCASLLCSALFNSLFFFLACSVTDDATDCRSFCSDAARATRGESQRESPIRFPSITAPFRLAPRRTAPESHLATIDRHLSLECVMSLFLSVGRCAALVEIVCYTYIT